jgi:predicted transcriptional regulator
MIDQTEPIVYKLKDMYAKCGKNYRTIGEEVGISELNVKRIINGVTQRPHISDVNKIWKAMTGKSTTSDLYDENVKVDIVAETPQVVVPTVDANLYNQMIEIYKEQIKEKDKRITMLIGLVAALIVALVAVALFG